MSEGRKHDLGSGFVLREFIEDDELIGYFVTGPAAQNCKSPHGGRCGGLCAIKPYSVPMGEGNPPRVYSVWQASGEWPNITLSPSVACACGGQHAYVRNGRWG